MLPIILTIEDETDRDLAHLLYMAYAGKMYAIAFSILHSREKAEDAVMDTFVRIIDHLDKFEKSIGSFNKRMIIILTRSVCFSMLRRENKLEFEPLEDIDVIPDEYDVYDEVISKDSYDRILKSVKEMGEPHLTVVNLFYQQGYTTGEIAGLLDMKPVTIRVMLHRIRKKLAEQLEKEVKMSEA